MLGRITIAAISGTLLFGSLAWCQSHPVHEIPPARQPAPTVPELNRADLEMVESAKTFSVFDPNQEVSPVPNELRSGGTNDSGTHALQEPFSPSGFAETPISQPGLRPQPDSADESPALTPLRPRFNSQPPQPDEDAESRIRPLGDAKLGYETMPQAPAMGGPQDRLQSLRLENEYNPGSGQSFPPVNNAPVNNAPAPLMVNNQQGASSSIRTDSLVQPVTFQSPIDNGTTGVDGADLTARLLQRYNIDIAPDPLPGQPTKLEDLLKTTPFQKRYEVVNAYWETYEEWALLINAAQRLQWLNSNMQASSPTDRALLQAAMASASNMIMESEIRLKEAQANLQSLANVPSKELLPLPSDQPLVKSFATHFDYFAKRQQMPTILKTLDDTMPKTLKLIETRAQTAQLSKSALEQTRAAAMSGQAPMSSLLAAIDLWHRSEVDLIRSVAKYNRSTAQYAFNFRPNQPNSALVKMLIGSRKSLDARSLPASRTAQADIPVRQNFGAANPQRQTNITNGQSNRRVLTPQNRPNNEFNLDRPSTGAKPNGFNRTPPAGSTPSGIPDRPGFGGQGFGGQGFEGTEQGATSGQRSFQMPDSLKRDNPPSGGFDANRNFDPSGF